ncbi:GGDEF domain-containing protein [Aestuariibacter sp. AA17]|uniref:diguanylate cyclase n=1 Tax=Fluctibacter corallii TaxID=2984329 RepID=A0ABT3A7T0_9ALTE|nr:GGDEF domain-containing protein [Aestuariibacter sp. AA17]MCV2884740.1 GGDEF domain-containing protein [Aestuariibacter sp. AA17]
MPINAIRQKTTVTLSLSLFFIILLASLIMPMFSDHSSELTWLGWGTVALMGALVLYTKYTPWQTYHPYIVVCVSAFALVPFILLTGGVFSQYTVLLPLFPVLVSMVANERATWFMGVGSMVFVVAMTLNHAYLSDLHYQLAHSDMLVLRAFWLNVAVIISCIFGISFTRVHRLYGRRFEEQANQDKLTGLANRNTLLNQLDEQLNDAANTGDWISVLLVDIDQLKLINMQRGQQAGDECLRVIALVLHQHIRARKDVLGRYGEAEFAVIMQGVNQSDTHKIAEKLRHRINEAKIEHQGQVVNASVTIGYSCLQADHVVDANQLLTAADRAVYTGKREGGNQVVGAEEAIVTSILLKESKIREYEVLN